ncbi:MAG: glycosyltransferase family 39 protein [Sphingomonadaceae bacterium]
MTARPKADSTFLALALAVGAAAIALRLAYLPSKPFWLDESWSYWFSGQSWGELIGGVIRYDTHPPFYYGMLKLWRELVGDGQLALRSLSLIASLATLFVVFRTVRSVPGLAIDKAAALVALVLASASPSLVEAARQARPYAMLILAFASALFFAFRLIRHWQTDDETPADWRLWLGYTIGLEGVLWLHTLGALQAFALAVSLALALMTCGVTRRRLVPFLGAHCIAGILWLPSFAILLQQQKNWTHGTWLSFRPENAWAEYLQAVAAPGLFGTGFFLLACCGFLLSLRNKGTRVFGVSLALCALVPALLEILLSIFVSPVFLGRTLAPASVPLALLASMAVGLSSRKLVPAAATACVTVGLLVSSWQIVSRAPEERWNEVGKTLANRLGPHDEVWLLPNELVLPFQLASPELSQRTRLLPLPYGFPARFEDGPHPSGTAAVVSLTPEATRKAVDGARKRGVRSVWVICRFAWLFDPGSEIDKAFGAHALAEKDDRFAPLFLRRYRVSGPADQAGAAATH